MADDPYNAAPVPMTDVRHDMPPPVRDDRDSYSAPRDYPPPRNTAPPPPRPSNAPVAEPSNVLGVFGLSIRTGDRDLYEVFSGQGRRVEKALVVYDQRSGRSRGFGFVTMGSIPDAESAIAELNGIDLQGRRIRVDFSATKRPHDPTPGEYRGPRRDDDFGPPRGGAAYGGGDDRWATRGGPSYGGGGYGGGGRGGGRYDDPYGGDSYRAPLPSRGGDDHRWSSRDPYSNSRDDDRSYRRSSRRDDSRSRSRSPAPRRSRSPAPRRSRSPAPRRSRGGDDYDRDRSRSRSPVRARERSRTPVKARGRSRSPTPPRND